MPTELWWSRTKMLINQLFSIWEVRRPIILSDQCSTLSLDRLPRLNLSQTSLKLRKQCNFSCFAGVKSSGKSDLSVVKNYHLTQQLAKVLKVNAWRLHSLILSKKFFQIQSQSRSWNKIYSKKKLKFSLNKLLAYIMHYGCPKIRVELLWTSLMTPKLTNFFLPMMKRGRD